jgi:hypothetical protein
MAAVTSGIRIALGLPVSGCRSSLAVLELHGTEQSLWSPRRTILYIIKLSYESTMFCGRIVDNRYVRSRCYNTRLTKKEVSVLSQPHSPRLTRAFPMNPCKHSFRIRPDTNFQVSRTGCGCEINVEPRGRIPALGSNFSRREWWYGAMD